MNKKQQQQKPPPARGYGISIRVDALTGSGRPYPQSVAELPLGVIDAAQSMIEDPDIESVTVCTSVQILMELVPEADAALAGLLASRQAPKLAELVKTNGTIAAEVRELFRLGKAAE